MTSFRLSIVPVGNEMNEMNGKGMAKTNTSPIMEAAHKRETCKATRTKIPTPGLARVPAPREGRIPPGGFGLPHKQSLFAGQLEPIGTNSSLDMIPGGWLP
jgi:hypothetical protein